MSNGRKFRKPLIARVAAIETRRAGCDCTPVIKPGGKTAAVYHHHLCALAPIANKGRA